MEKIVAMSEVTDVRDKFTKAIQYFSRFMVWRLSGQNAEWEKKYKALFGIRYILIYLFKVLTKDARKIFRLFKSVNEFKTLRDKITKDLVWQPKKTPIVLEILSKLGFFFYWIFDNIQILSSIKFLNADPNYHLKLASISWVVGLIFGLAKNVWDLIQLFNKKCNEKKGDLTDSKIDFLIIKTLIEITGKLGDLVSASNGAGIPQMLFGRGFSDGVIGIGGLWASIVSLWAHYIK